MKWIIAVFISIFLMLIGCASPSMEFEKAKSKDSSTAYQRYIRKFPNHKLADEAKDLLAEKEFEKALKKDSVEGYKSYLKNYAYGSYVNTAREKLEVAQQRDFMNLFDQEIEKGDYAKLIELSELAKINGYSQASSKAIEELGRWEVSTAGAKGIEIVSEDLSQEALDSAEAFVRIRCAVTTSVVDNLNDLLVRNSFNSKLRNILNGNELGSYFQDFIEDEFQNSDDKIYLYFFPDVDSDEVSFNKGEMEFVDKVDGRQTIRYFNFKDSNFRIATKYQNNDEVMGSVKNFYRRNNDEKVFSIFEKVGNSGVNIFGTFILIGKLPEKGRLSTLQGRGIIWYIEEEGKKIKGVDVSSKEIKVILTGTARLDSGRWISIGEGIAAKGGTIRFEETKVIFEEGTLVAKRKLSY